MASLKIHTTYENPLTTLDALMSAKDLVELEITGSFIKSNLPFGKLKHLNNLERLVLETDLGKQGTFVNQQIGLRYLHLKKMDMETMQVKMSIEYLRIDTAIKNEQLLPEKFPNLKALHLHGCTRLNDFTFLASFQNLEKIYIGYNAHIKGFPLMKAAGKVTSIKLPNAYNFANGKSLLQFVNLETLWLTSHDKPLALPIGNFTALQQLKKLKTVYTVWGKKTIPEVEKIYRETGWINSGLGEI